MGSQAAASAKRAAAVPRVLLSQGPRPWPFFLLHTKPQRSCIMNAAVTNMAVMFGAMQVAKRIPFDENPEYVRYAQLVYVTSQLLCLAVFYYCSIQVRGHARLTLRSSARTT